MSFGIKRTPGDAAFSDYIRYFYDGVCQKCKSQNEIFSQGYHCSHFHGRGNKSVRFDPDNAVGLCAKCHFSLGGNPHEHKEFFFNHLGEEKYDALVRRKNTPHPGKVDDKAMKKKFKIMLEELKQIRGGLR